MSRIQPLQPPYAPEDEVGISRWVRRCRSEAVWAREQGVGLFP